MNQHPADLILHNGKIATQDDRRSVVEAAAIRDGKFLAIGSDREVMRFRNERTKLIDLNKRTVIPGLNDSHLHLIRGGLNYNLELRWDGVPSLADGLRMLREQAQRTPPGQWVRVVGGWSEFQFAERRMPTLDELNQAAPDTPVFVLHLYDRALLNRAALRAVGYTKDSPNPPGGEIARDAGGNPTGILIARPNAMILYATLAKGPKLPPEYQANSSRHFMRELNRLGITSAIDAGGGFQNYPEDYQIIEQLHKNDELTVRIAYNLFTQKPKGELADFQNWTGMLTPRQGDDYFRHNGAGEMLVFSAADFEDFLEPRPDMPGVMEQELKPVVSLLAKNRWPFRLHATYDETITRALNVYEEVNREIPLQGLHWFIDHAETISQRNMERIQALGGGIAIQNRMAFQGEYFRDRYGDAALEAHSAGGGDVANGPPGRGRDGRYTRRELQPVRLAVLAGHWQDRRRSRDVPRPQPPGPDGSPEAVDGRQQLVFRRRRQERRHRSGPTGRPRGPLRRLLLRAGRGDQTSRIGANGRRRKARVCGRGVQQAGSAAAAGAAGMVSGCDIRRLRKAAPRGWRVRWCGIRPSTNHAHAHGRYDFGELPLLGLLVDLES